MPFAQYAAAHPGCFLSLRPSQIEIQSVSLAPLNRENSHRSVEKFVSMNIKATVIMTSIVIIVIERLSIAFTANGKREFIPRDQVSIDLSFTAHYKRGVKGEGGRGVLRTYQGL